MPLFLPARPGLWTPVLTCDTPGNLSVTYNANGQLGSFIQIANLIIAKFNISTATFTHTSGESGNLKLTGLPTVSRTLAGEFSVGDLNWGGITKANYTDIASVVQSNSSEVIFLAAGSGQSPTALQIADAPTAASVRLRGTVMYSIA